MYLVDEVNLMARVCVCVLYRKYRIQSHPTFVSIGNSHMLIYADVPYARH